MLSKSQVDRRNRRVRRLLAETKKLKVELSYAPNGYKNPVRRKIEENLKLIYWIRAELIAFNSRGLGNEC